MSKQRTYLQDILKRIALIQQFTVDGHDAFLQSEMVQESVIRCYEVIGEIVKRLDAGLLAKQPHIPWKSIAGFRDVLIHNYDEVELTIVWKAVEEDLPDLKTAIQTLLSEIDET